MSSSGAWTLCRVRNRGAKLRLYCFPHAGGSAGEYAFWGDDTDELEVMVIQLPGRGPRLHEPCLTEVRDVRDAVLEEVTFIEPFALFGHSLGAVIAFEVARALEERGTPPRALFVSSARAPDRRRMPDALSALPDRELLDALASDDSELELLMRDSELRALALPALRADLQMAERYVFEGDSSLQGAICALGGSSDEVTEAELAEWASYTSGPFVLRTFEGGHFYTRTQRRAILQLVAKEAL